jgi:nucleoside-diphosphate-sugar epimerase
VIPSIVSQLAAGSREVRLGDLTTTRDFTFVEDTCRGLLAVASIDGAAGEVFNIGSNCEISIEEVFRTIVACMGVDAAAVHDDQRMRPAASEVRRLRCEGRKLELASGFRPAVSFAVGISRTVDWLSEPRNLGRYRSDVYSV